MTAEPILSADALVKHFPITKGAIRKKTIGTVNAVNGISIGVAPGETLGRRPGAPCSSCSSPRPATSGTTAATSPG